MPNNNIFNNIQLNENNANPNNFNYYSTNTNLSVVNKKQHETHSKQNMSIHQHDTKTYEKLTDIGVMLKYYGEILKSASLFHCQDAINIIKSLPLNHQKTGFLLSLMGKCYCVMAKYKDAEKVFQENLKLDPARLEGLEYYSTCLWHLKDQYQLCNLANHALEQSHFCAETWIVVGNCYSLQKEHEIALKFFNRATQINSTFAYAYTLCGHEYVDTESFKQAKECYKSAIACDSRLLFYFIFFRHYNAWWGLGNILLKEQNYSEAISYFKNAIAINENNGILHSYLAQAHQFNKDINKASIYIGLAEKYDPISPMIRYQRANICMIAKRYDEALEILLGLVENMPKEASVHMMIGKIFKIKKEYTKALTHFNLAIDIEPKDSNMAKSLIEKLYSDMDADNTINCY